MRRPILLFIILLSLAPILSVSAQEVPELKINSKRFIVMDAASGQVYAQKGAHDEVPIASLTKIFTAVQALEMAPPDTLITTDESDLFGPSATVMGFGPNETYTLEDLIYGMMLPSGNDAAHAIARSLGGYKEGEDPEQAVDRFMGLLNQRILDMGLQNTHLITPSGWGVPGHHSSAWDVAAMMQHAIEYPVIEQAISARTYTTSNGAITLRNVNKLMNSYESLLGGKTGYDEDAGWCLVEVAESGGRRMIAVTLDGIAPDDWYDDNRVLLEYGFDQPVAAASQWGGDVVTWSNPAIAEIERSAKADTAISGGPIPDPAVADSVERVPVAAGRIAAGSVPAAVLAMLAILGARGAFAFQRWPMGRQRARTG